MATPAHAAPNMAALSQRHSQRWRRCPRGEVPTARPFPPRVRCPDGSGGKRGRLCPRWRKRRKALAAGPWGAEVAEADGGRRQRATMNNKFDALKDDDSGDHDQNEENNTQKDSEKEKNDREKPQSTTKRKAVVPGPAEHPLQYNYTFWYSRRTPGRPTSSQSYEQNIKQIGTFASVEQFWRFYSHMVRPGDLTGHSDFHLFKEGIKPMWEDDANKNGGKWIIRLRKGLASRCWENLILAMLGEQFMVGEEICGAVVSVRFQEDIISIWNKTASDQATTARIRDTLRRVLNLPPNTIMEYKTHTDSINSRRNRYWDHEANGDTARRGARRRWHELDHRGADAAHHRSQADLSHLPCQQGQNQGAPEVTEGHGGDAALLGWGKGLCRTEMIPWGKEGWWGRESCADARSRVDAKEKHP
ncbi:eukaryotic translation initiation factor 4E type 2 isoform X1 [Pithys albifrons albifrons]|uniref:eukaryotic translation initiation factor 4E type 2 isoform X1 n=1 Tax=Pithys albifrons albifrons TaxID=3385563 RepID=UPI003A5D15A4